MRAYHRIDPLMDERKGHYTPAQLGAFLKIQLVAGRQTQRGRFRSVPALKAMLPSGYARYVDFLVSEGDLTVLSDGKVYIEGWDEWQEGDLTVKDRMARLRNKRRNTGVSGDADEPSQQTEPPSPHTPLPPRVGDGVGLSPQPPGGGGLRANGTNRRALAEQEREEERRRAHEARLRATQARIAPFRVLPDGETA